MSNLRILFVWKHFVWLLPCRWVVALHGAHSIIGPETHSATVWKSGEGRRFGFLCFVLLGSFTKQRRRQHLPKGAAPPSPQAVGRLPQREKGCPGPSGLKWSWVSSHGWVSLPSSSAIGRRYRESQPRFRLYQISFSHGTPYGENSSNNHKSCSPFLGHIMWPQQSIP